MERADRRCLGLVGGDVRTRDGVVTEHYRNRPLSERESPRWIENVERAKPVLALAALVVADLESNIDPVWTGAAGWLSPVEPGHGGPVTG